MPVAMYGIKNCDTIKKARAWLEERGIPYAFHDYKLRGIDRGTLERWSSQVGWERLLNRSGTTIILATHELPLLDKFDYPRMVLRDGGVKIHA